MGLDTGGWRLSFIEGLRRGLSLVEREGKSGRKSPN